MSDGPIEVTRRTLGQMLLAWPLAATAAAEDEAARPAPSPRAACFAATEPGLLAEEKARLEKSITDGEKALGVIRDFKLSPDVPPALRFAAMRSKEK